MKPGKPCPPAPPRSAPEHLPPSSSPAFLEPRRRPRYRVTFNPASISFTAAIAAASFSGSRERTTRLVFGFLSSSWKAGRSEEHTFELQSHLNLVFRLLLENKNLLSLPCHL